MFTLTSTVFAAPYRVLEGIWYHNLLGKISESQFQYPYQKELIVEPCGHSKFRVLLKSLTGTHLDFLVTDHSGLHSALISISATAIRKNQTQVKLVMTQSSLNGTTDLITDWLETVIETVGIYYETERKSA